MDISSSKLLPILGTLLVALTVMMGVRSCSSGHEQSVTTLTDVPKAQAADADSPGDTLRALTAQVAAMKQETEQLRQSNEAIVRQKRELSSQISTQVKEDLRKETQSQTDHALSDLTQRIESLRSQIAANPMPAETSAAIDLGTGAADHPVKPATFRIEPLNAPSLLEKLGLTVNGLKNQVVNSATSGQGAVLPALKDNAILKSHLPGQGAQAGLVHAHLPEPVYTVPRNATLIGSTGMTALIGRIPIKGNIDDPYPFKVIVGSDNLAANGLEIPGIDGMIFTGTAIGDWTLSCVRGHIHSVTFVFEDGTIRTLSSDDQSLQQKNQQIAQAAGQPGSSSTGSNGGRRELGWISDRRGIPCISGTRVTNAPQYLGGRFLARALGAAGEAYARSQTTVTSSPLTGGVTGAVTGNPTEFALGSMASGSADELADWIAERQAQNYDAIFVDTGAEVAVHIDRELPIDFEMHGRKLTYARKTHPSHAYVAHLD